MDYSRVWGYGQKCVGFLCMLFWGLNRRKQKTTPGYRISHYSRRSCEIDFAVSTLYLCYHCNIHDNIYIYKYLSIYLYIYIYINIYIYIYIYTYIYIWPWLSPLRGWGSLTMTSTGKFVYMAHHFILLRLNLFGLMVDREG